MSSHLGHIRRELAQFVRRRIARPDPLYRADFSDDAFYRSFSQGAEALNGAAAGYAVDKAAAQERVLEHFRKRQTPRFFVDVDRVSSLADIVARTYPQWKTDAIDEWRGISEKGPPIYGQAFSSTAEGNIDWRAAAPIVGGDVLFPVRPHRFGFVPRLALAAHYGEETLPYLLQVLKGWTEFAASEPAWPYISNLVVQYRGIALGWAWLFVAGLPDDSSDTKRAVEFLILKILQEDLRYLSDRTGDSHPNNHLLCDGFIGWLLATTFPEFSVSERLLERSNQVIESQLLRQTYEDGTSFEHSVHYHEMGCEMVAAYILICRCNNIGPKCGIPERFAKMLRFQTALGGPEATPVPVGDATEDPLFPLDAQHGWGTGAMRELYRSLFKPGLEPTRADTRSIERAFWLLAGELTDPPSEMAPEPDFQPFEQGGFYVFSDQKRDSRLIFRSGPAPGTDLMAGHMHADILSICLTQSGTPVIVDPGTYSYRSDPGKWPDGTPPWRYHFMGPGAHSGLVISEEDPLSELAGDFRHSEASTRVKQIRCRSAGGLSWVEGENIGNSSYAGHRRGVIHVHGVYWLVYDVAPPDLPGRPIHLGLQFSADTEMDIAQYRQAVARTGDQQLNIAWSEGLELDGVLKGEKEPPAGWVTPRYGVVDPAPYARFNVSASAAPAGIVYATGQRVGTPMSVESVSFETGGTGFAIRTDGVVDYLLWQTEEMAELSSKCGLRVAADCLWLRTRNNAASELRWLGGRQLVWEQAGLDVSVSEVVEGLSVLFSASGDHTVTSTGASPSIRLKGPPD